MGETSQKLLASVVTYNPGSFLIDNVLSYLDHVAELLVIDNSDDKDPELIEKIKALPKVTYIDNHQNLGIAKALNIAAEYGVVRGYKWLLTMDQDSFFCSNDFFEIWENERTDRPDIAIIAASYTSSYDRWQKSFSENFNAIHYVVTSGNINRLDAWQHVGGFEEKLFIDEVDNDYCIKLRNAGYNIITSKKEFLQHAVGEYYQLNSIALKAPLKFNLHAPIRYYYMARNTLYVCKKYFFSDLKFAIARFLNIAKLLAKIIVAYPDKLTYLKCYFAGISDFILSRYGKKR